MKPNDTNGNNTSGGPNDRAKQRPGNAEARDAGMQALLDRLVCDELEESSRRPLLAWLEEDPRRWRRCGLAFLEAQTWSRALSRSGPPPADGAAGFIPAQAAIGTSDAHPPSRAGRAPRRRVVAALIAAAGLLLAFGLGASLRELLAPTGMANGPAVESPSPPNTARENTGHDSPSAPPQGAPNGPTLAAITVRPASGMGPAATIRIPVAPAADAASAAAWQMAEVPEYVLKQWERRGLRVSKQRRYLFATLPNGESVVVPVEQLQVEYVKSEVY